MKGPLLASDKPWEGQRGAAAARRVVKVRGAGVQRARDLYEPADAASVKAGSFADSEAARMALEAGCFAEAALQAGRLLRQHPGDDPLQLILSRAPSRRR